MMRRLIRRCGVFWTRLAPSGVAAAYGKTHSDHENEKIFVTKDGAVSRSLRESPRLSTVATLRLACSGYLLRLLLIRARLVQSLNSGRIQLQLCGLQQLIQLLQAGGAGDRGGDARPRDEPGQSHLRRCGTVFFCDTFQRVHNLQPALVQVFLDKLASRALFEVGLGAILTGKKSAGQREIRNHSELFLDAQRFQPGFIVNAIIEVVVRLQTFVAWISVLAARLQ